MSIQHYFRLVALIFMLILRQGLPRAVPETFYAFSLPISERDDVIHKSKVVRIFSVYAYPRLLPIKLPKYSF